MSTTETHYQKLFDALQKAKEYNDVDLQVQVYGAVTESKKWPELKAYLYDFLLQALTEFDEKHSPDIRLRYLMSSAQVLMDRSLNKECYEQLQKARTYALETESFLNLTEIQQMELRLAYHRGDLHGLELLLVASDNERVWLEQHQNLLHYKNLFYTLFANVRRDALLRSEEKKAGLAPILNNPLLLEEEAALSYSAKYYYWRIKGFIAYTLLDKEGFYSASKAIIELIQRWPKLILTDGLGYLAALSNLTLACGMLEKYEEVEQCLGLFEKYQPRTREESISWHLNYYGKKMSHYIDSGNFAEAAKVMREEQENAADIRRQVDFDNSRFYFMYFYVTYGIGDYDGALEYLNTWLNLARNKGRMDTESLARILQLIVHFETGNDLLLSSLVVSATRYLRSHDRLYNAEKLLLRYFKTYNSAALNTEKRNDLLKLKEDLLQLKEDPNEEILFRYFDFIVWVDSRIQRIPYGEAKRQMWKLLRGGAEELRN